MIEYSESVAGVQARHLEGFFVGWPHPGSELMRRMLARLENLYMVDLCCDADLEPFHARLGLRTWDRGMGIRNREVLRR